jgi:branched-chain amino acid transport system ATP-binding protein
MKYLAVGRELASGCLKNLLHCELLTAAEQLLRLKFRSRLLPAWPLSTGVREPMNLADRISVLVCGKIIASDTPERICENPAVREAYLGEATH